MPRVNGGAPTRAGHNGRYNRGMGFRWEKDEDWQAKGSERWHGYFFESDLETDTIVFHIGTVVKTQQGKYTLVTVTEPGEGDRVNASSNFVEDWFTGKKEEGFDTREDAQKFCEVMDKL
jgi:hypothetical protein